MEEPWEWTWKMMKMEWMKKMVWKMTWKEWNNENDF